MTEQQERITLPLARLRWLQEMGIAPALLRSYAPGRVVTPREQQGTMVGADATEQAPSIGQQSTDQQGAGRTMFEEMLRSMERPQRPESKDPEPSPVDIQKEVQAVPAPRAEVHDSFTQWRHDLLACEACARCDERAVVLPGVGVQEAPDWFVFGGMPTRQDEGAGRVWSASAGRLLAAQLRSMGLNLRQQVYLSYALKCRSNQPQASAESIAACRENFLQELSWVQPKHLLLLGEEAVQMLWGDQVRLDDLRGTVQYWTDPKGRKLPVVVTVDPTTLLLRPQQKARAWHDLLVLQQVMAQQAETH